MSRPLPPRFDYAVLNATASDGDTVRCRVLGEFPLTLDDDFIDTVQRVQRDPRGMPIRLLWVNTPEHDDPVGWRAARTDTRDWLATNAAKYNLRLETHGREERGGRTLGDIYYFDGYSVRHSLSEWLIRDRGWPIYEGD